MPVGGRHRDRHRDAVWLPALLLLLCGPTAVAGAGDGTVSHLWDLGTDSRGLVLPTDVAVAGGRVYVVDSGRHRVRVFAVDGRALFDFGQQGPGDGAFESPVGIAAGPDGRIYVADRGNHRVQVFGPDGRFVAAWDLGGGVPAPQPVDVAVDPGGRRVFVTEATRHEVLVLDREGRITGRWGGRGGDHGAFRYPATLVVLADGRVAVVDVLNTRAQVFSGRGEFLAQVGDWGVLPGQLFRPKGIAVDARERLYISDSYMGKVQVFTDDGSFRYVLQTARGEGGLEAPVGMAIDGRRLYVVEMLANRVAVFGLED